MLDTWFSSALARLAPAQPIRSLRQGTRAQQLREARTCYDHLAGRLGVAVMTSRLRAEHLSGGDGSFDPAQATHDRLSAAGRGDTDYQLTQSGHSFFAALGVTLPRRGAPIPYCVDWTEQRHHLAGATGRGMFDRLVELDWVRRAATHRAVIVTPAGQTGLAEHFDIDWPPSD